MDIRQQAIKLANIDEPEKWKRYARNVGIKLTNEIVELAECLWIERMIGDEWLLLHPSVKDALWRRKYEPNLSEKAMVWANVLSTCFGVDGQMRERDIGHLIRKKHGDEFWKKVNDLQKQLRVTRQKIYRAKGGGSPMLTHMVENTLTFATFAEEDKIRELSELPKEI